MKSTGKGTAAGSGSPPPATQAVTVRSLLVGWANQQDGWVRQLVSEIIVAGKALTESQLDAIYQVFLKEKALMPGGPVVVAQLNDDPSSLVAGSGLFLTQLGDLKNVNALAESQKIDFNPKLTVVFGENACGKTGYVRVLKKAAAVRTSETVLPDLSQMQRSGLPPSARISYRLGQEDEQAVEWKDQAGLVPFNRIDVFDSRATLLHVDGDLNYVYTPGELARFPLVQRGIEGVRTRLDNEITSKTQTSNPFLAQFDRQSKIYPLVDSLGAATDLGQLKELAVVTDAEKQEIETLKTEIDALRTTNPAAQLKLAETGNQHLDALKKAFSAVGRFDISVYGERLASLQKAEREYESATQESFAGLPIPGLLQDEWRQFIRAGEEYLRALEDQETYPDEGKDCLYCRQPLSPEAVALLRKYRDFCNNDLRAGLDGATHELDAFRRVFNVDFAEVDRHLGELVGEGSAISQEQLATLKAFAVVGKTMRDAVETRKPVEWSEQATEAAAANTLLEGAYAQNGALIAGLTDRREKRDEALRERQAKLVDIESRLKLAALLPQIDKAVDQAKWVDKAKIQARKFQGLLRSLTDTSKLASEQLLNKDFERHFAEECKTLGAPAVTLQFPGRQGQVTRKKAVAGSEHRPSDVLSEGEQKVIALADFLAEASLKPPAPVIFDDPINSLDFRRMEEVVNRIVSLSDTRQVIVFTHNIWFTTELLARFEKRPQDCSYFDVARDGTKIGIVTKGTHPRSDTFSSLKGRINVLIKSAEKATGETQSALIEKAYELMRNICEVVVEEDLLQGVTKRYQPNVMMTRLPSINFAGLQTAVSAISPLFEDCCRYIASHSQPMETLNVRPTLEALKADWSKLQEARDAYKKVKI
jgi:energy-coupling factor transporter ATP-binding protein EcfA2